MTTLHIVYDFGGKEVTEDFVVADAVAAAIKSLGKAAAKLTDDTLAKALEIATEFYGEIEVLEGKNSRQAFEHLKGKPDESTDERRAYQRMYSSFVVCSPRQESIGKNLKRSQDAAAAKDTSGADAFKLLVEQDKEKARSEAKNLCRSILRAFASSVADPAAPTDEYELKTAEQRIRDTIADYNKALENPRGPIKVVAEALMLRTAVYALNQVLIGKIKIPQATPQRDRSAEQSGPVREYSAEEIAAMNELIAS